MALNYSVSLRPNPLEREASPKAYATAQMNGELSLKQLSRRVSSQTTVSRADVVAVLTATVDNLPERRQTGRLRRFRQVPSSNHQSRSRQSGEIYRLVHHRHQHPVRPRRRPEDHFRQSGIPARCQPFRTSSRTACRERRQSGGRPAQVQGRTGCLDRRGRTRVSALIQKIMYHFKPHCYGKTKRKINLEHHYQSNYCSSHRHRRCAGYSKLYLIFNS